MASWLVFSAFTTFTSAEKRPTALAPRNRKNSVSIWPLWTVWWIRSFWITSSLYFSKPESKISWPFEPGTKWRNIVLIGPGPLQLILESEANRRISSGSNAWSFCRTCLVGVEISIPTDKSVLHPLKVEEKKIKLAVYRYMTRPRWYQPHWSWQKKVQPTHRSVS